MTRQSLFQLSEPSQKATRRQHKHDLLLTFMANATDKKRAQKPAARKPRMLQALLSIFL